MLSSNISEGAKKEIPDVLGVRCSTNLEKYLELPNVAGKRKKESFQNLKDKVNQRISQWSSRLLSQGGNEVFIKSVLQAIPTYAMTCFLLLKSPCGDFRKHFCEILVAAWKEEERDTLVSMEIYVQIQRGSGL
ncbi:reverse transcriptase [Gossypium australe]|uniref:Reverse transcriptase n=1 Tax=Gossypium australe TaxID=47621 RepID=A0A5B6VF77_9ROSI|nr:reverse transcriptase [Gossypium australe]